MTYAAAVGGEEADDVADLARLAEPAQRDRLEVGRRRAVRVDLAQPLGVDPAGRDRVDGDAVRAELARECLQPADEAGADRVREREVRRSAPCTELDVIATTRPWPLAREVRQAEPRRAGRGEQQQLDRVLDRLGGRRRARSSGGGPPPFSTSTSMPPNASSVVARRAARRCCGFVRSPRTASAPIRSASRSSTSRRRANIATFAPSAASDSAIARPDPGGRAADDRRAPAEAELHWLARSRTPTTSRTAAADSSSQPRSCSVRSSSTISSMPAGAELRPARPCRGRRCRTRPRGTRCTAARASRRGTIGVDHLRARRAGRVPGRRAEQVHDLAAALRASARPSPSIRSCGDELRQRHAADRRRRDDRHHLVAVAAEHERGHVLHRRAGLPGDEGREARRVEDAGHAEDALLRPARDASSPRGTSRRAGSRRR